MTLEEKEKILFFILVFFVTGSFSFLAANFYFDHTRMVPASGGIYVEGVVGSPRFINPVYADTSDIDRDITQFIFSGLLKYNAQGQLVPGLAESYEILQEGKVYEFTLKRNLVWEDSQPLTSDDVVFTIETIQNPEVNSPLRPLWLGVEVEKISDSVFQFRLKNASSVFLENCTVKIIPKHIWESISPKNFSLTSRNLKDPIGSGPYMMKNIAQDPQGNIISLELVRNPLYSGRQPYLSNVSFHFFNSENELVSAYRAGEIDGFSLTSLENFPGCVLSNNPQEKCDHGIVHSLIIPRYFSVLFNPENSKILADRQVRLALTYGTDKETILDNVFSGQGRIVDSPVLPDVYGFNSPTVSYNYDEEQAVKILKDDGFLAAESGVREKAITKERSFTFKSNLTVGSQGTEVTELQKCLANSPAGGAGIYPEGEITGYFGAKTKAAVIRFQEKYAEDVLTPFGLTQGTGEVKSKTKDKLNEVCFGKPEETLQLKFTLVTVNQPILLRVADILKEQWSKIGADVEVVSFDINTLQREVIRQRDYDALLFGEVLGMIPDPFPFWHSSQKGELGLNLANYENKECDKLLEDNRTLLDPGQREEKLEEFQDLLIEDCPAVFLYNPYYHYLISEKIKGIEARVVVNPSQRLSGMENWYIKTKRVLDY